MGCSSVVLTAFRCDIGNATLCLHERGTSTAAPKTGRRRGEKDRAERGRKQRRTAKTGTQPEEGGERERDERERERERGETHTHTHTQHTHTPHTHTHTHTHTHPHTHTHTRKKIFDLLLILYVCSLTKKGSVYNFNGRLN